MKNTLQYIITEIVDAPDKVVIEEETTEDGVSNFNVTVDKDDMGKIIGKEGKVIRSIRNVMKIKAMKQNKKVNVSLTEIPTE